MSFYLMQNINQGEVSKAYMWKEKAVNGMFRFPLCATFDHLQTHSQSILRAVNIYWEFG